MYASDSKMNLRDPDSYQSILDTPSKDNSQVIDYKKVLCLDNSPFKSASFNRFNKDRNYQNDLKIESNEESEPLELDHILLPFEQPPTMVKQIEATSTDQYGFVYDKNSAHKLKHHRSHELRSCTSRSRGISEASTTSCPHNIIETLNHTRNEEQQFPMANIIYKLNDLAVGSSHNDSSSTKSLEVESKNNKVLQTRKWSLSLIEPAICSQSILETVVARPSNIFTEDAKDLDQLSKNREDSVRSKLMLYLNQEKNENANVEQWMNFIRKIRHLLYRQSRRNPDDNIPPSPSELIGIECLGNIDKKYESNHLHEFHRLVVAGIPVNMRAKVWSECLSIYSLRRPGYYEELLENTLDKDQSIIFQIDMDINRTLSGNVYFSEKAGKYRLRNVLVAYSRHNPNIGYCQGINVVAAMLLLIFPTEEDVFYGLMRIIESILPPGYYTPDMISTRVDLMVLKYLVQVHIPKLYKYFQVVGVDLDAITFGWFISLYTDCLPPRTIFRFLDILFTIGDVTLFRIALAILCMCEESLLTCQNSAMVYEQLKKFTKVQHSTEQLIVKASYSLSRVITTKRILKLRVRERQRLWKHK